MKDKFKVKNARLSKFLYSLGFDKESVIENKKETWLFEKSERLQESLDFFFYMRDKNRGK